MTVESYKGYQIESARRGGIFQISKSGKHMATGNSLVDARFTIDDRSSRKLPHVTAASGFERTSAASYPLLGE